MTAQALAAADAALFDLLSGLEAVGYDFVSPTPATHRLVARRRRASEADVLRDILGWGRTFDPAAAPAWLLNALTEADAVREDADGLRARLRVSRLDGRLHLHSASGADEQAVFLGPDSYRYVRFLHQALSGRAWRKALEIGVGAGAGALAIAALDPEAAVVATDINPQALRLCRLNARHAGLMIDLRPGGSPAQGVWDLIAANPPYMAGRSGRLYRDGGDHYGAEVALEWAAEALSRLAPGGCFLLYTGAPIVAGQDLVRSALTTLARQRGARMVYEEIDPDVFGASLAGPSYAEVERIAAVGAVVTI